MGLNTCPPSFKIVKLGDADAERNAINAGFQAILRCLATKIEEAPVDGNTYGRKDGAWIILP